MSDDSYIIRNYSRGLNMDQGIHVSASEAKASETPKTTLHQIPDQRVAEAQDRINAYEHELAEVEAREHQLRTLINLERASLDYYNQPQSAVPNSRLG